MRSDGSAHIVRINEAASGGALAASEYDKSSVGVGHALVKLFSGASFAREFLKSQLDLEIGVMDKNGAHALIFPARKTGTGWVNAATKKRIEIQPTHWRKWADRHGI